MSCPGWRDLTASFLFGDCTCAAVPADCPGGLGFQQGHSGAIAAMGRLVFTYISFALLHGLTALSAQATTPPPAKAAKVPAVLKDSAGGSTFEKTFQIAGKEFQCLGAGGHKILFYKVYSNAFCIETSTPIISIQEYINKTYPNLPSKKLIDALEKDKTFFSLLSSLPGDKMIQIRFLRDLKRDQVSDAMVKAMRPILPPDDVKRVGKAFRARDPRKDDLALIYSQGETLHLSMADSREVIEQAPVIVEKIWLVWLGDESPTPNLREDVARRFGTSDGRR